MGDLTTHFSAREFECTCCGKQDISMQLVSKLEAVRKRAGIPLVITSGFRCKDRNDILVQQGKAASWSSHLKGLAADIYTPDSVTRKKVLKAALDSGLTRIGIGSNFIHVDIDDAKDQGVVWTYPTPERRA